MDREQSWQVITEQRLGLARLLEGLSETEWEQPSLCGDGGSATSQRTWPWRRRFPGWGRCSPTASGRGGNFHRLNHDVAVRHAARPTREIVAELRTYADSRRLPVVTNYRNILFDVLVHAQDIAIPLGRDYPMPSEAARAGADRVWTMGWPFWARHRLRGVRLLASDTDWSAGAGVELRGPIRMILLLLTGRTATALPYLSGLGVHTLTERFAVPRAKADQS